MIKLSKSEQKVLDILGSREMTLEEIAREFYGRKRFMGANMIGNYLRRIKSKWEFSKDVKTKVKSKVLEGNTRLYWIE